MQNDYFFLKNSLFKIMILNDDHIIIYRIICNLNKIIFLAMKKILTLEKCLFFFFFEHDEIFF